MANVLFKRGLKQNLPQAGTNAVIDGSLYFTTDTCQLYLGQGSRANSKMLPIGDNIRIVSSVNDLGEAATHIHEFAYISSGNILAWSDGTAWKQTNPNTENSSLTASVASDGTVTITVIDSKGARVEGDFSVVATTTNVHIGESNGALTISVDPDQNTTYSFTSTTTQVEVTKTTTSGTTTSTVSAVNLNLVPSEGSTQAVTVIGGTGINVGMTDGKFEISVNGNEISGISGIDLGFGDNDTSTQGFYVDVNTADGDHVGDSINPVVAYGGSADQSAHFVNGTATLSVYTKGEVDDLIASLEKGLDAMVYRGTASDATDITSLTDIKNGDVWKASREFILNGQTVKPGYVIIARGTEGSDGYIAAADRTFDVIVGDATDTTYTVSGITNGIKIVSETEGQIGSISVLGTAGNISATESGSNDKSVTLDLANVTQTATSTTTFTQTAGTSTVTHLVDSVSVDAKGRVTGITTKDVVLRDTITNVTSASFTVSTSSNVADVTVAVLDDQGGRGEGSFSIGSSGSLSVTSVSEAITVDLVWGQF